MIQLVLPDFQLSKRQPDLPHVAHTIIDRTIPNEYGVSVRYRVRQARNKKRWTVNATIDGMRYSNTVSTGIEAKAKEWIKAIETGCVSIDG